MIKKPYVLLILLILSYQNGYGDFVKLDSLANNYKDPAYQKVQELKEEVNKYIPISVDTAEFILIDYENSISLLSDKDRDSEMCSLWKLKGKIASGRGSNPEIKVYQSKHIACLYNNNKLKELALLYGNMAKESAHKGDLIVAENFMNSSIKLYAELKDSLSLGNSHGRLGIISNMKGDTKSGFKYNFKALDIFEKLKDHFHIAKICN